MMSNGRLGSVPERYLGVALTALAALVCVLLSTHLSAPDGGRAVGPLGVVLVVVGVVTTGLVLRWPLTGVAVCAVVVGCYLARHYPYGPILVVGLLAVFLVGWRADRRRAIAAIVLLEAGVSVGWLVSGRDDVLVLLYLGWSLAAAFLGGALRSHRRYREEQQARTASLERSRRAESLQQVAEQRLRIARDLHDGVAHAMATINVQAAGAARVMDRHPEAAKGALEAIAQASGTVLDELNAVVAVLRDHDQPADRVPTPGLADVADLVFATSGNGLTCDLDLRADPAQVGTAVGTAAYRIVQESLTNVLRHSGAAHAEVSVVVAHGGGLVVQVRDDGPGTGAPSRGTGTGIVGMRERAEATGGTLNAGRHPDGYVVRAEWAGQSA